ncbi:hypothetical protein [Foetidibacter luteolus]|uniref:hypothetical protein n=1 Tax=Foetidibacter luteolus TaxID=2608880 RepID=UPI00129AFBD0|nr:hypothetical protein [Foetidibacter luteolus]
MKKITLTGIIATVVAINAYSQYPSPDQALKSAWFIPNGTARSMAIGGAMGSLGGDLSAANVNPAGIGLYKTREFVFTPGLFLNSNNFNYRDEKSTNSKSAFAYGTTGFVGGTSYGGNTSWTSTAFSISITQLASYNNNTRFAGFNDFSSYTEQWIEELEYNGVRNETDALSRFPFGSSLAYKSYLIDTIPGTGGENYFSQVFKNGAGTLQDYNEQTTGGYHEISLGFAGNKNDRLYLGGSINIPFVYYSKTLTYSEYDPTGDTDNDFDYFTFTERYKSTGIGLNAKLGLIYKVDNSVRLGFAIHTPSYIIFNDQINARLQTNTEGYANNPTADVNSDEIIREYYNGDASVSKSQYAQLTPYRLIASGTYIITGASTQQQKGFITADVEFVNYRGSRYSVTDDSYNSNDYFDGLNEAIKQYNKGAVNFRLGGELKFNTFMVRLGGAYYGSPYKDGELKASRLMGSGGIGYRNRGFFVDLTYVYSSNKDVYFPYRLTDKANTFAQGTNNRSNVLMTVGFKL